MSKHPMLMAAFVSAVMLSGAAAASAQGLPPNMLPSNDGAWSVNQHSNAYSATSGQTRAAASANTRDQVADATSLKNDTVASCTQCVVPGHTTR
jgi:invasion protein IalB